MLPQRADTPFRAAPKLKLWQVLASGTGQITDSDFYRSIPADNPLVISILAGCHAVSIAEHGGLLRYFKRPLLADFASFCSHYDHS